MTETVTVEKEVYESVLRVNCNKIAECERLQKQLDIAVKALDFYSTKKHFIENDILNNPPSIYIGYCTYDWSNPLKHGTLSIENGSIAQKALQQIKELNK